MNIIINPGTGPVSQWGDDISEENAIDNIKHYITDCNLKDIKYLRLPDKDEDGRFGFILYKNHYDASVCHFIDMPGLPLAQVRYIDKEKQNIWDFPRLYVDGDSWVWCYGMLSQKDFDYDRHS